jgi:hypothetical protein
LPRGNFASLQHIHGLCFNCKRKNDGPSHFSFGMHRGTVVFHSTQCALRSFLKIRGLPKVLISSKLPKLYKGKVTHADELKTPIFLEKKKNQKAFVSSSFSFWKFHH